MIDKEWLIFISTILIIMMIMLFTKNKDNDHNIYNNKGG